MKAKSVHLRDPAILKAVNIEAKKERRNTANMLIILLMEALNMRKQK